MLRHFIGKQPFQIDLFAALEGIEPNLPFRGNIYSRKTIKKGGFPGPVRTDKGCYLSRKDIDIQLVKSPDTTEIHCHP